MRNAIAAAALLIVSAVASPGFAADAARGKTLFEQQCSVCHSATGDAGQGPHLAGVVGHKFASDPQFAYSPALKGMTGVWTEANLATFMQNPDAFAPGSNMPITVDSATDRADLAAYLATLPAKP